jgi:hypothetical protein
MNNLLTKGGCFILLVVAIRLISSFCLQQTDGFAVARLQSAFPSDASWNISSSNPFDKAEFEQAIQQKYSYLGFGGQCFAFESEDQQYVIKFFKQRFIEPQKWLMLLPLPNALQSRRNRFYERILSKHCRDFNSYKIAYDTLKEETGLIYIHLNKTNNLHKQLTLSDKLHINHQIDLDQTEFIIQKKAQLVYPYIDQMMSQGNSQCIQQALHSILSIIVSRCQKGIFDEDPRIHCNVGLIGTQAIFIDVGRFKADPQRTKPEIYKQDISLITARFKGWLADKHPSLVPLLEEEIKQL